jgi:putative flippase GtrA
MWLAQHVKRWVAEPVESVALQVPRALVASIAALVVDFSLYVVCVRLAGMPATGAAIIGYLAGGVLQYVLCSYWVFSTSLKNNAVGFVAFTVLSLGGLGITWVVILIAHDRIGIAPELAKATAVGITFAWNFFSRKLILFRPESPFAQTKEPVHSSL